MWVWWWPSKRGAGTNLPQGVNRVPELCESSSHRLFTGSFGAQFGRTWPTATFPWQERYPWERSRIGDS